MQRLLRKAVVKRFFSTDGPRQGHSLLALLTQYRDDKDIIHSRIYQALVRVFEYQQRVAHKCGDLAELHQKLRAENQPANLELMTEYFRVRKDFGFDEHILAQTLHLLSLQDQRGMSWKEVGVDVFGSDLINSPIFHYMLDDVRLLLNDRVEVDLDALRLIVKALTRLQFRDFKLLKGIGEKIEKMVDFDSPVLGEKETHIPKYFIRPSLDNYVNLPQKDVLQNALKSIIGIKHNPGRALEAVQLVKPLGAPNLANLEQAMDQLEKVIKGYAMLNLDFFHTVYAIREYYFDLKSEDRMAFMQANPDLLLDFLRLEQKLLLCGFLMPKNLLEKENSNLEDIKLLVDRFLFQQRIDPKIASMLIRQAAVIGEVKEGTQEPPKDTIQPELVYSSILGVLEEMMNWTREKFPSANPDHDFANKSFLVAVGSQTNTYLTANEKIKSAYREELQDRQFILNQDNARMPHHGYSAPFHHLSHLFLKLVERFRTNTGPNRLSLGDFDITLLVQLFSLARRINRPDLASEFNNLITSRAVCKIETLEAVIPFIADNMDYVSYTILRSLLFNRERKECLLKFIRQRLNAPLATIEDKFTAFFLGVAIWGHDPDERGRKMLVELLDTFLNESNLSQNYFVKPGYQLPLTHDFLKFYFVLNFALKHVHKSNPVEEELMHKAYARVCALLEADWEIRKADDPAYALILPVLEGISKKYSGTAGDMVSRYNFPPQMVPAMTVHEGKKALFLLRADQFGDSILSKLIERSLQLTAGIGEVEFVRIRDFFADGDYQTELKFDLRPDLDLFLSNCLTIQENSGLMIMHRFLEAMNSNIATGQFYDSFKMDMSIILGKLHQQRLEIVPSRYPQVYQRLINQYYFLACYLDNFTTINYPNFTAPKIKALRDDLLNELLLSRSSPPPAESLRLKNRYFGLEPYTDDTGVIDPAFEFLSLKPFSDSGYFVIPGWRESLLPKLGPVQFHETNSTFFNKFGKLKKIILPSVSDRRLVHPPFQLFWEDMLRPSTPEARLKAQKYNELAHRQPDGQLDADDSWKLSLLNFIYEFRAKPDVGKTFSHLSKLDLWKNLARIINDATHQSPKDKKFRDSMSVFNASDLEYFFDPKIPVRRSQNAYQLSMKEKLEVRDRVLGIQQRLRKELPEAYQQADSETKRQSIFTEYQQLQKEYVTALEAYRNTIDPYDSIAKDSEIKDLVYRMEGSVKTLKLPNEEEFKPKDFFQNTERAVKFASLFAFELVALYKRAAGIAMSYEETHALNTMRPNKIQLSFKAYPVAVNLQAVTLRSVLSPSDDLFFSFEFPNMEIHKFLDRPVTDFLCAFAILGDVSNINLIRNREVMTVEAQNIPNLPEGTVEDLVDTMSLLPRNSLRFYHNYLETKKWHEATSISADDLKIFKDLLTLTRGDLTRRRLRQQKVAAHRPRGLRGVCRTVQRPLLRAPPRLHQM